MIEPAADLHSDPPNNEVLASKTVVGAVWLMGWRMFSRCLGMLSTLILARILMPKDFGMVAMATTFSAILDWISVIGVQDALVRRQSNDRTLFNAAFTLQASRGLFTALILTAAGPLASWWFNEPRMVPMMMALGATAFVSGLENVGVAEYRRNMQFGVVFWLLTVPRLVSIIVAIGGAILLRSYWALLIAGGASAVVRTVMTYVIHPFRPKLSLAGWRQLAGFSFWIWATGIATVVYERIDVFALGPTFGQTMLGLYIIAWELGSLPNSEIVFPISDALFAGFAKARNGKSSAHHAPQVAAMLVIVIVPVTITISCASGYVVAALLGPQWSAARPLVAIMAWLCLFAPLSTVSNTVLIANGHMARAFSGKAIASLIKIAVLLAAVLSTKRISLIAAAVTACVAIESCGYLVLLNGLPDTNLRSLLAPLARALLAGMAVVGLLWSLHLTWQPVSAASPVAFLACAAIGLLVLVSYLALLWFFWLLAGRPKGPETRLIELSAGFLRPILRRITP
jgi:lipopolysaccharide exporter